MSGRRKLLNIAHQFGNRLGLLFDPGLCQLCGIPVAPGSGFCRHCRDSLNLVANPCSLCGLVNMGSGSVCPACLHKAPPWQQMIAPMVYHDDARELIQQLKFHQRKALARALVSRIIDCFDQPRVEVLLPVPMHRTRRIERGFNQAEEIARELSRGLRLPIDRRCLKRVRETSPQSGLSLAQRGRNLQAAIDCVNADGYTSVAVVDDIITSGSTMQAIAHRLRKAGVRHIEVWALARTLRNL